MSNLADLRNPVTVYTSEIKGFLKLCDPGGGERALASIALGYREGRFSIEYCSHSFAARLYLDSAKGYADGPPVAVPFRAFSEAMELSDSVSIHWQKDHITIHSPAGMARMPIIAASDSLWSIASPDETFPIHSSFFTESLPVILKIVSPDSPRSYGTVVLMECSGSVGRLIGTDGFRLSYSDHTGMPHAKPLDGITLPHRACQRLLHAAKSGKDMRMAVSSDRSIMWLISGDTVCLFRTSPVKFPNYRQVLPKMTLGQTFDVKKLKEGLKQALLGADKSKAVSVISSNGKMAIRSKHKDDTEFRVSVDVELSGPFCLPYEIFFNGKFLLDCLTGSKTGMICFPEDPTDPISVSVGTVSTIIVPINRD